MKEILKAIVYRYIALDIHKHYSVVAGVDFEGQVVVEPVRIEHADQESWLKKHIQPTDYVVIESTTNAWHIYDLLEPLAEKVLVANPIKVKQIAQARVKTDIRDTLILARLLAANMVPVIWVPPLHVRNLRYLLSQRRQLVGMYTATVNRMHSVAYRHHLNHPKGKRFNEKNTKWQRNKSLSDSEQFQLELDMNTKKHLYEQAEKISEKLRRLSHQKPWAESMMCLMQLPGFGVITGMTVLAAIGEITRFESPRHLASYSGLTPGAFNKVALLPTKCQSSSGRFVRLAWTPVLSLSKGLRPGGKISFCIKTSFPTGGHSVPAGPTENHEADSPPARTTHSQPPPFPQW